MTNPKLFVSYSWSSPEHEQRVLDLATELRESGVDVILDKWDLKEGHDAVAFMEQMVTNPKIGKVAIICDEKYAAKADGRSGGVGTETQIISRQVYENQAQEKFVAVVFEKDSNNKPYLPTYYKARIYIDLCDSDKYAENFDRLLRWIFDKPLYLKPNLGDKPSFLSEGEHLSLGTTALYRRCIDALRNQKTYAAGAFDDYCRAFVTNLERLRIVRSDTFDEAVVQSINEFLPYRNEAIHIFITIAQYAPSEEIVQRLHRFFEELIPYMDKPANVSQWNETDFDNFRFIVHELFLYVLAIFLKYERFEQANALLVRQYYYPGNAMHGLDVMVDFGAFHNHTASLDQRNVRLGLGRQSLRADLIKKHNAGTGIEFQSLLQADFVAFMRAELEAKSEAFSWWPETLVYLGRFHNPLEIFARCASQAYFDKVKILLGIGSKVDLQSLITSYQTGVRRLPKWGPYGGVNPVVLLGYERIGTRP
jgi:hypothetical protein